MHVEEMHAELFVFFCDLLISNDDTFLFFAALSGLQDLSSLTRD